MKISARNVFAGTVQTVTMGAVNAEVTLALPGGDTMVAIITNASVDTLQLSPGTSAYAIIKASEVMIGKGLEHSRLSARNVLPGQISKLVDGAVNSEVEIKLAGGTAVVASITKASVHALDLREGDAVSAVIKASHVLLGI